MSRFNLRKKPRISYYEIEEPNLDEYIYCDECTDFVYEYCAIHGPLLVVPDKKVSRAGIPPWVPSAALTTPKEFVHIAPSYIPGAGLGVFSTLTLPRGVRFGPYKGVHMAEVKSTYCWQIKSPDLKSSRVVDAADGETSNWLRYVNCSRSWREQNLVAFQYRGQIYYRTIKIIPRFTELLVFYGSEFASALGVDLRRYNAPPHAQYGALPVKKPAQITQNQDKHVEPVPTMNNIHKTRKDGERSNVTSEIKGAAAKKPKGKRTQKGKEKFIPPNKAKLTEQHQIKLDSEKENTNAVNDKGAPPAKKRRAAKQKFQEKPHTVPASDGNPSKSAEISKESNFTLDTNNVHKHNISLDTNNIQNNTTVTNKYICNDCGKSYQDKSLLSVHIKCHDIKSNVYFECKQCDYRTVTEDSLQKHMQMHDIQRPFQCHICEKRFNLKQSLKKHLSIHTGEKPYQCNICQYRCNEKGTLKTHLKTHTEQKPLECNICEKRFSYNSHLTNHLRIHSGEKPYQCNICQYRCNEKCHLKRHLRTHTGEKPYQCNICQYRCNQKSGLKRHLRTHTGEKPYQCNICQYRCNQKSGLKTHLRTHTGEKPYQCNICQYRCNQKSDLKTHLRTHTGEKPFQCNICQYRCNRKSSLKTHLRTHTGEKPVQCNICQYSFSQKDHLKKHLRTHCGEKPYQCNIMPE